MWCGEWRAIFGFRLVNLITKWSIPRMQCSINVHIWRSFVAIYVTSTTNTTHYIVTLHCWAFYENAAHFSFKVVVLFLELNDFLLIHVTNSTYHLPIYYTVSCNIAEHFMIMWHTHWFQIPKNRLTSITKTEGVLPPHEALLLYFDIYAALHSYNALFYDQVY